MKRLILASLALALVACSAAPTTPRKAAQKVTKDLECRSGYQIAYRADGTAYCAPN